MTHPGAHSRFKLLPRILLILIPILTAFRPGDASWVNDEPILMEMAIRYNHTASHLYGIELPFTPCPYGLQGTRGARYGPLPVWIDQVFLAFTHNLILILAIRAFLFTSFTAVTLNWLAKTLRLSPWFAVIALLSPWIWLFARSLWDNTWCIPISALLLAAYASFVADPKPAALITVAICCFILPLIHLTGVAMALPVLLSLVLFHRDKIWRWRWRIILVLSLCLYLFWPYFFYSFTHIRPGIPLNRSPLLGWFFPLLGGHFLTLGVAGTMPGDGWQYFAPQSLKLIVELAQWISRGALVLVWMGMALAIPRAWVLIRHSKSANVTDQLCFIALCVWICQTLLDGIERLYFAPYYYSGTWIAYLFFAWIAADWLLSRIGKSIFISLTAIYALSLLVGSGIIAVTLARNGGTRNVYYGTSLGNQIAAIQKLRNYSDDSPVDIQLPQWQSYPWAWKVLMELNPPTSDPRPRRNLVVKYRDAYVGDAHIEVEELSNL
jgi:hypothetical protein